VIAGRLTVEDYDAVGRGSVRSGRVRVLGSLLYVSVLFSVFRSPFSGGGTAMSGEVEVGLGNRGKAGVI
jgi:hypothetical protein